MILEVKLFPESQEVMHDPEWFFIQLHHTTHRHGALDPECAYAKIITDDVVTIIHEEEDNHAKQSSKEKKAG